MQEKLIRLSLRTCLLAACVSAAPAAFALSLGDLEVRSALGEALDARIPLGLAAGEQPDAGCFALAVDPEPGVPVVTDAQITVEGSTEGGPALRIRTPRTVSEPALRLRVRAGCAGLPGVTLRQYSVLLDPRRETVAVAPPLASPAPATPFATAPAAPAVREAIRIEARGGDTLEGLAARVFPRTHGARQRYLAQMRALNPALASLANDDPLPEGVGVALPDLRDFARGTRMLERPASARPARHSADRAAPRDRHAPASNRTRPAGAPARGDFVLKLSNPEIDVTGLREMDDAARARIRQRQIVLDSDDQVAEVLALRNSVRQLEARVNDLQLKLAQMPASFPARADAATDNASSPDKAGATNRAAVPAPPAEAATAANAKAAESTRPTAREPRPAPTFTSRGWEAFALWGAFLLVLGVLLMLVWRLTRRRIHEHGEPQPWPEEPEAAQPMPEPIEIAPPLGALTEGGDRHMLRRRYLEERFPEVINGALDLDDPASVVRAARLFHEDGAPARAVELLRFAIAEHPDDARAWLAMFELYRAEGLAAEFAELARRFYDRHGDGDDWRKVQRLGRELDPANLLYKDDAAEALEDWLEAPAHPHDDRLATELRRALMARARLTEQDLAPDPLPALRDAETFTVA